MTALQARVTGDIRHWLNDNSILSQQDHEAASQMTFHRTDQGITGRRVVYLHATFGRCNRPKLPLWSCVSVAEARSPVQVYKGIAYRLAYETHTLELELIQRAIKKLQQQQVEQQENSYQLRSDTSLPFPGFFPPGAP